MSGGEIFPIDVTLRDPVNPESRLQYRIHVADNQLGHDWYHALCDILDQRLYLEKNFCFLGFPYTARDIDYLCHELNWCIQEINHASAAGVWDQPYWIEEHFCELAVRYSNRPELGDKRRRLKHSIMNRLHNHFEILQGTVGSISRYYESAPATTRYAIRQLNTLCHELESLILSRRKIEFDPQWVRPSQITTFFHAARHPLTSEHRRGYQQNGYDRETGGVYMHWAQIGKTLFEVWRDEHAPRLDATVCEAVTHLQYYSGEFDIEWGRDVVAGGNTPWHDQEQEQFRDWLLANNLDPEDPELSLGYLKIAQVDLDESFGTRDCDRIWRALGQHLDIYSIETGSHRAVYDYSWADPDYKQQQIHLL